MYEYYSIIKGASMVGRYNLRIELVRYAQKHGIRKASRDYEVSRETVRKWLRRYHVEGLNGLYDKSKAPHNQWKKCSVDFEDKVKKLRIKTKNKFGSKKLIERFNLENRKSCIDRIIRDHPELRRKKKTRTNKRNDLWSIKKLMKAFEKIQIDVKDLMDIANYYPQAWKIKGMPRYEITARCVKTGATWICLSKTKDASKTSAFVAMLLQHLKDHGFDLTKITLQMDNGTEFHNLKLDHGKSMVEKVMEYYKVQDSRIPPAAPTFNSDVETFHRLVEDEFYSIERFKDKEDLRRQAYTYTLDFNYLRNNMNKDNKTPYELLLEDYPDANMDVLNYPIVDIGNYFHLYSNLFVEDKYYPDQKTQFFDLNESALFHGWVGSDVSRLHKKIRKKLK